MTFQLLSPTMALKKTNKTMARSELETMKKTSKHLIKICSARVHTLNSCQAAWKLK